MLSSPQNTASLLVKLSTFNLQSTSAKNLAINMVIGLLAITAIPTVTGVAMGVSEQRKANERKNDERRMAKFNIDVAPPPNEEPDDEVQGLRVVLRDFKVRSSVFAAI